MEHPACYQHERTEAIDTCYQCTKPICSICSTFVATRVYCPACAKKARSRRFTSRAIICVLLLAGLGALIFYFVTKVPPFDYGKHTKEIKRLTSLIEKEPCDREKIVSLADLMLTAGDHRRAIKTCEKFFEACGEHLRLRWITYGSYKRLSEYPAAIREVSKLIENSPDDKDYWWWRGIVYERSGELEKAAFDYQQAIAIEPRLDSIPFNLASVYERLKRPCEALFPIEQYIHYHPDDRLDHKIQRQLARLREIGKCDSLAGDGRAEIKFSPEASVIMTRVKINGKFGNFILDTGASYVTLSAKFAESLGIRVKDSAKILVQTAGGIQTAHLTTIDTCELQGLTSQRLPAVIIDGMPDNVQGLLGLSFLARYTTKIDREAGLVEISSPKR
ncbi:MAG: aspartyl protease family protein [Deltaproteobacteria bacterium]|nr:aspartyl protease family protein [Deltaproteobacteria bacterium]